MELSYEMWHFTHGMISTAAGSSYIESRSHKVVCTVSSPSEFSDLSSTEEYQRHSQAQLSIISPFSSTVKSALESMILLEKYPKSLIEVKIQILAGDENEALVFVLNAASLAILDSGIEVKDTLIASNVGLENGSIVSGGNSMVLGLLVNTEKISVIDMNCEANAHEAELLIQACFDISRQMFTVVKSNY